MTTMEEALERTWMPRLVRAWRAHTRQPGPSDELRAAEIESLGKAARALSDGLIGDRELIGESYLARTESLGAYLMYFWPTSFAQAHHLMGEHPGSMRRVLDLGGGPGPMGMAALERGATHVDVWDREGEALEIAEELARGLPGKSIATRHVDIRLAEPGRQTWDVIVVGHALNELWADEDDPEEAAARRTRWCIRWLGALNPGGSLILIEPALKGTSRGLLEVRDRLVDQGYALRAPCMWRGACPALERERDWCHVGRRWRAPEILERIAARAGRDKRAVKMSYLVVAPRGEPWAEPPGERAFRIVSEPLHSKGRYHYVGCGAEGRVGLTLLARDVGAHNEVFEDLARGDVIALGETLEKGDGLRMKKGAEVRLVVPAGEAIG